MIKNNHSRIQTDTEPSFTSTKQPVFQNESKIKIKCNIKHVYHMYKRNFKQKHEMIQISNVNEPKQICRDGIKLNFD